MDFDSPDENAPVCIYECAGLLDAMPLLSVARAPSHELLIKLHEQEWENND